MNKIALLSVFILIVSVNAKVDGEYKHRVGGCLIEGTVFDCNVGQVHCEKGKCWGDWGLNGKTYGKFVKSVKKSDKKVTH